ncbi:MAG: TonB-dependent receptor [Vicinamibacterales bacterium]|nr:TonB-dependent receptor [Vicinamibacterales bacterium]
MNRLIAALLLSTIVLSASAASAQIAAVGTVRGYVKDSQGGVLPGVTVTVRSATVSAPSTTVSDQDGFFRLVDLAPADYRFEAELAGFAKYVREPVAVRAGLNITFNLELAIGGLEQVIEVTAETPLLETQRAGTAVNISGQFQRDLPLTSRSQFSDFLEVTPGIAARAGDATGGGQIYMMRGGELENHVIQLDGADMGSFRQNRADRLLTFNTDAVSDVQVTTGAIDASTPLGSGAVVNVSTKSGTDALKGVVGAVFTPEAWNGNNAGEGTVRFNEMLQPDLSLGGPILKGRLWFYGAYRYTRQFSGIGRSAEQVALLKALKPTFEPFNNAVLSHNYYAKLSGSLSSKHQWVAFYERDTHPEGGDREWYTEPLDVTSAGGTGIGVRLQSVWGSSLTSRVMGSYNDKSTNSSFDIYDGVMKDGPSINVHTGTFISSGRITGTGVVALMNNMSDFGISPASKKTFQADTTYYKSGLLGSHEVQTGVFLQALNGSDSIKYPNGGAAMENVVLRNAANPAAGYTTFHRQVFSLAELEQDRTAATDLGFYIQDAWRPTPRVTINVGVRLDKIKATEEIFDIQLQDAWHVGPRAGVTWTMTADAKNVARASFARVHEMPMPRNLGSVGAASSTVTNYYDNNLDGVFETVLVTPGSTSAQSDRFSDPDHHQPFIDEYTVGYGRQLPGGVTVNLDYVHREYKDIPALVETNGIYDGNVFKGYKNENFNQIYSITNDTWNTYVYNAISVNAGKRSKRLQLLGSYTRGFQHVEGTWRPNDPASFLQPDAYPNDTGIGSIRGNQTNSLSGSADTRSPSWQKHNLRLGSTFFTPWGVVFALNYSYQSGAYSGPVVTRIAAADPQFGPSTVTLSNGRRVSNPLATTVRFAYPTRGDGQLALDALQMINVRVGYNFAVWGGHKIQAALDIFNVTNRGAYEQWLSNANQQYSPNYGLGRALQFPRVFQASLRYAF